MPRLAIGTVGLAQYFVYKSHQLYNHFADRNESLDGHGWSVHNDTSALQGGSAPGLGTR